MRFGSSIRFAQVFALIVSALFSALTLAADAVGPGQSKDLMGVDMSLEGLRAYGYSLYIFGFLILSLIFFSYIIYLYAPKGAEKLKIGEKIMFGSIIFGVVIAVVIGYVQLIEGYLF